jgi:Holliday junction resolvase
MPNKSYTKGTKFEYRVRDYFKDAGYEVFRMAGSHTQADLICFPRSKATKSIDRILPLEPLLIQCKTKMALMSKSQRQELIQYCQDIGVQAVLAYRDRKRKIVPMYLK